ncbi:MAG: polysaccharide pyruvyl transferase CsaB [Oscillospiraceae bacterium]|jgi:polysaccharide pyruvyl transferase CsaB|nr:polysaccharide pyruvyl transferase CsaB [Oscillospiraceae bacterium]
MKVLHLIGGGDVGGAKTHVVSLLAGLKPYAEVTLVSFREGDFSGEARSAGIDVRVMSGNPLRGLRPVAELAEGYDLIHCHGARGNLFGMMLKRRVRKPVVTTVHSDYRLDYMDRPLANMTYGLVNRFALRRMDYFIGVSDVMTRTLIRRGFPAERTYTVYNGLDFSAPARESDKASLAAKLGVPYAEGDVIAGIAARFDPVKDLPTLIRAAARLKGDCPRLRFLIAGDGRQGGELRRLAEELNAPVRFVGWLQDTGDFFRLLDINLLTSRFETFSYALTEGARAGCATVASEVGGAPILIDHGVNGFLFPFGDGEKLAGYIQKLYDDPALRHEMGDRLHTKAEEKYSIGTTIQTQAEIYASVLRRRARAGRKRDGLTICGAYGMNNAGDDAILEAILLETRREDPDIPVRVLSRSPLETRLACRERTFHSFNVIAFARALRKSRVYLSGGGNLVQDVTSRRSLWFYLFTIWLARKRGCRVVMYGCGVGPVLTPFNRRLTARVLTKNVDIITLREESSLAELAELGVRGPEILLSADPALILTPESEEKVDSVMLKQGVPPDGRYIGFALRDWPGFAEKLPAVAEAAEYACHAYGLTPVFVPVERGRDVRAGERAAALIGCSCHVLRETGSARLTIGLLSRMQMVVAMRLHALIFAAGQGLPMVALPYNEKVGAFMKYMGQDLCAPLESLTGETLKGLIDRAAASEGGREERLAAVAALRERERVNGEVLSRVLKDPLP